MGKRGPKIYIFSPI